MIGTVAMQTYFHSPGVTAFAKSHVLLTKRVGCVGRGGGSQRRGPWKPTGGGDQGPHPCSRERRQRGMTDRQTDNSSVIVDAIIVDATSDNVPPNLLAPHLQCTPLPHHSYTIFVVV